MPQYLLHYGFSFMIRIIKGVVEKVDKIMNMYPSNPYLVSQKVIDYHNESILTGKVQELKKAKILKTFIFNTIKASVHLVFKFYFCLEYYSSMKLLGVMDLV